MFDLVWILTWIEANWIDLIFLIPPISSAAFTSGSLSTFTIVVTTTSSTASVAVIAVACESSVETVVATLIIITAPASAVSSHTKRLFVEFEFCVTVIPLSITGIFGFFCGFAGNAIEERLFLVVELFGFDFGGFRFNFAFFQLSC